MRRRIVTDANARLDLPSADSLEDESSISAEEFEEGFGETLQEALDVDSWRSGEDLGAVYRRIDAEVAEAVRQEKEQRTLIRTKVFPRLADYAGAPPEAGVY